MASPVPNPVGPSSSYQLFLANKSKGSAFQRLYLPMKQQQWQLALAEAQAEASSAAGKDAVRQKMMQVLATRSLELDKIAADYNKEDWGSMDAATKLAREGKYKEQLQRMGAIENAAIEDARSVNAAARASVIGAGMAGKVQAAVSKEEAGIRLDREKEVGSRAAGSDALLVAMDNMKLPDKKASTAAAGEIGSSVKTWYSDNPGKPYPVEGIAQYIAMSKNPEDRAQLDKIFSIALTKDDMGKLTASASDFGQKEPVPAQPVGAASVRVRPNDVALGNVPLPSSQGSYNADAAETIAMADARRDELLDAIQKQQQLNNRQYNELGKQIINGATPDLIDSARAHYAQHFAQPIQLPHLPAVQRAIAGGVPGRHLNGTAPGMSAPLVDTPYGEPALPDLKPMYLHGIDSPTLKDNPVLNLLGAQAPDVLTDFAPDANTMGSAISWQIPFPGQTLNSLTSGAPSAFSRAPTVLGSAPTTSRQADSIAAGSALINDLMKPPLTGGVEDIYQGVVHPRDATPIVSRPLPSALPIISPYLTPSFVPANAKGTPPVQAAPALNTSKVLEPPPLVVPLPAAGPPVGVLPGVKPPMLRDSSTSHRTDSSPHPALQGALDLERQPRRADRLLANDEVSKTVAGLYSIDKLNLVPPVETAKKVAAAYAGDKSKLLRAMTMLTYLLKKDNTVPSPSETA